MCSFVCGPSTLCSPASPLQLNTTVCVCECVLCEAACLFSFLSRNACLGVRVDTECILCVRAYATWKGWAMWEWPYSCPLMSWMGHGSCGWRGGGGRGTGAGSWGEEGWKDFFMEEGEKDTRRRKRQIRKKIRSFSASCLQHLHGDKHTDIQGVKKALHKLMMSFILARHQPSTNMPPPCHSPHLHYSTTPKCFTSGER